jgi:hypothetical protein
MWVLLVIVELGMRVSHGIDICCSSWIWAVKKASDSVGEGFGVFICGSKLVTTLLRRMCAS